MPYIATQHIFLGRAKGVNAAQRLELYAVVE